jgi:hypothetical protein
MINHTFSGGDPNVWVGGATTTAAANTTAATAANAELPTATALAAQSLFILGVVLVKLIHGLAAWLLQRRAGTAEKMQAPVTHSVRKKRRTTSHFLPNTIFDVAPTSRSESTASDAKAALQLTYTAVYAIALVLLAPCAVQILRNDMGAASDVHVLTGHFDQDWASMVLALPPALYIYALITATHASAIEVIHHLAAAGSIVFARVAIASGRLRAEQATVLLNTMVLAWFMLSFNSMAHGLMVVYHRNFGSPKRQLAAVRAFLPLMVTAVAGEHLLVWLYFLRKLAPHSIPGSVVAVGIVADLGLLAEHVVTVKIMIGLLAKKAQQARAALNNRGASDCPSPLSSTMVGLSPLPPSPEHYFLDTADGMAVNGSDMLTDIPVPLTTLLEEATVTAVTAAAASTNAPLDTFVNMRSSS